jgi:hypothetical protein
MKFALAINYYDDSDGGIPQLGMQLRALLLPLLGCRTLYICLSKSCWKFVDLSTHLVDAEGSP